MNQFLFAKVDDLERVAACHRTAFPDALTSRMGLGYLKKLFSWYLSSDKTFLFTLDGEVGLIGYCGAIIVDGTLAHGSASGMTQHTFKEAIFALLTHPWLLFHKDLLSRYRLIAKNIGFKMRKVLLGQSPPARRAVAEPHVGLVVIGVDPRFQGKGFGTAILVEFERVCREKGYSKLVLSVKTSNEQAIRSYTRNGWYVTSKDEKTTSMEKRGPVIASEAKQSS